MSEYRSRFFSWPELVFDVLFFCVLLPFRAWTVLVAGGLAVAMRALTRRFGPENSLGIDARGLHLPYAGIPWSNVDRIEPGRPPLSWSPRLFLKQPLRYPAWLSPFKVSYISLARYESNWLNGRIGADIARWGPHLLDERHLVR